MPERANTEPQEASAATFAGFALPTSNTTYTPNQFFDVCLPHRSRGCVRLVAYLIRKTLGWSDVHGNPLREQHAVPYSELQTSAGISRDMIRSSIDEAIAAGFIHCVEQPLPKRAGASHHTGLYALSWDEGQEYVKDPKRFKGFFAGDGNRTYIPNQFFDHVVRSETLAVIKVVGSIIRFSIGFQTKWGHRRQTVALSYQHIQNYTKLADRKTLSAAIQHAIAMNYIQRVADGYFDPDAGRTSRAATYAVKWLSTGLDSTIGQKTPPVKTGVNFRSENPTEIGQKTPPADQSENPTDIEITDTNNISKQHEGAAAAFSRLVKTGFDLRTARAIATHHSAAVIDRQIDWIALRNVRSNKLGMLRLAIEQDWPPPARWGRALQFGAPNSEGAARGATFDEALKDARRRFAGGSSSYTS